MVGMKRRFQFGLKTLLVGIVCCAVCCACFIAGTEAQRIRDREFHKEVEQLFLEGPDRDMPAWRSHRNKRANDVFHGKKVIGGGGDVLAFAVDQGDGYMLRFELYEDGTYGYDRVPAAEVAAEMQVVKMPGSGETEAAE
jgi:hypothetical protein